MLEHGTEEAPFTCSRPPSPSRDRAVYRSAAYPYASFSRSVPSGKHMSKLRHYRQSRGLNRHNRELSADGCRLLPLAGYPPHPRQWRSLAGGALPQQIIESAIAPGRHRSDICTRCLDQSLELRVILQWHVPVRLHIAEDLSNPFLAIRPTVQEFAEVELPLSRRCIPCNSESGSQRGAGRDDRD